MPFDPQKVPAFSRTDENTYGTSVRAITPTDGVDATDPSGSYFKYVVARSSGDVAVLGYRNVDGDAPVVFSMLGGQVIPLRVRRVLATGTTATVAGVMD